MVARLKIGLDNLGQFEIWFVDDGSEDTTLDKIKNHNQQDSRFKCLSFSRNFGHHNAIAAGIDYANGDRVVLMDGDLQDRPESIPLLLEELDKGYDIVLAQRSASRGSKFKQWCSKMFWRFIRLCSGLDLLPNQSIMRAFNRPVLEALRKIKESNRFYSALFNWVGFKQTGIQVQYDERASGQTKYSFRKQLKLAADAIFGFGNAPLWILMVLGVLMLVAGLFGRLPSLVNFNPLLLLGLIFIALGVITYQIRQALRDSKERPLYIIKEIIE